MIEMLGVVDDVEVIIGVDMEYVEQVMEDLRMVGGEGEDCLKVW